MNHVFIVYHSAQADDNVFETCLNTLRLHYKDHLVVVTDDFPERSREDFKSRYNVEWDVVEPRQMQKRRATCKIERLKVLVDGCSNGDHILVADADIYFADDPMIPFETYPCMELGMTTRGYTYQFPINAGIFYLRITDRLRVWLDWHLREIFNPTWEPYVAIKRRCNHFRLGLDWSVSQDFLIACWNEREKLDLNIVDAGPRFNFCPPTDVLGKEAGNQIVQAFEKKTASILHLKSDLKYLVYEGRLPNCVIRFAKGRRNWF